MRVALYARVSTDDKGQDPEVQLQILRDLAAREGYEVVGEYVDHASGKDGNRPQFKQMREAALKGRFDAIMAVRIDRIMRSVVHLNTLVQELREKKVSLIFTDMALDYNKSGDMLVFQVIAAIAEWERGIISTRTREGLAHARVKGKHVGRASRDDIPIKDVMDLRRRGASWRDISERFGIPASTIRDRVKRYSQEEACEKGSP